MNSHEIEELLKRAPAPPPPPQLKRRLLSSIALPASPPEQQVPIHGFSGGLKARWLRLAAGLVAVLLVGWGSVHNSRLTRRNLELTQSLQELQDNVRQNADSDEILNLKQEIERLRGQNRELHQLRAEVAALRPMAQEIEGLRLQNQRLLEAVATQQVPATNLPETSLDPTDDRTLSMACINNLKQIGLSARVWANDNDGILPPDLISMTNELSIPVVLHCPADQNRPLVANWSQFQDWHSSYQYLNPGGSVTEPGVVLARCSVHGHIALSDGSVQDGKIFTSGQRRLLNINGRWELDAPQTRAYYERLMMERYGIIPGRPADSPADEENEVQPSERFRQRYGLPPPEE